MNIPKGKKVIITQQTDEGAINIPFGRVPLVIEEDITLSFSSNFSPLVGGTGSKALSAIGAAVRDASGGRVGFSGQNKYMGFQVWEGSSPISFNATFGFYLGQSKLYSALQEVYRPVMELVRLVLPDVGFAGSLIPPGPSLFSLIKGKGEQAAKYYSLSITIAKVLRIDNVIITKAEPTFSNEVDEDGYPIWAKVAMDFQSVELANTGMLNTF